jgi:DNA excision repair protein ERCC-2
VRALVEFALRRGNLGGDRDFVSSQRALAGTRGHQRLQRSRPSGYQQEVRLRSEVETDEFILWVQGRIDGVLITSNEVLIEEIKTVQGGWDGQADPLHWAQAKLYAWMYAKDQAFAHIVIQLTYLDLDSGEATELRDRFALAELEVFFRNTAAIYLEWLHERHRWCEQRDETIRSLGFPFPEYRPGQRELAVAAFRTLARGGRLFLEAPTGIGKTISVLFPAVKALGEGKLERIFYLTARTVGRFVAQKAFADLHNAGLRLRTLTLTAKEKICVRDRQACDPRTCPLATGYYDRVKPAMRAALGHDEISRATLEAVAAAHQVCPFELSLDLSLWVDAVICDYNYVFDPKVYLRRHFADEGGDYAFLVDESHNLVDRAREMFSAELTTGEIQRVRRAVKGALPKCARALSRLSTAIRKLCGNCQLTQEPVEASNPAIELNLFPARTLAAMSSGDAAGSAVQVAAPKEGVSATCIRALPEDVLPLLEEALKETEAWLAQNQATEFREELLELYFQMYSFRRTAELYDERYVTIVEPGGSVRVRLFCLDPSFLLRQALERGKAAVFFSATLTPIDYYRALLGGDPDDPALRLRSPFPPENFCVLLQHRIRTHYKSRAETLDAVVEAIAALVGGKQGNYMVYLPSYQYLTAAYDRFHARYPALRTLVQNVRMSESEREAFLAAFAVEHTETLVGFAVMGGVFGEGIDLVGDRLIGAVIVGVGLPQLCFERDLMRDYFQERLGAGFDYAYSFPGMNRVLQATGRVIRSETDRGVVLLIDTRFAEARYTRLFPHDWKPLVVRTTDEIRETARQFWGDVSRLVGA